MKISYFVLCLLVFSICACSPESNNIEDPQSEESSNDITKLNIPRDFNIIQPKRLKLRYKLGPLKIKHYVGQK